MTWDDLGITLIFGEGSYQLSWFVVFVALAAVCLVLVFLSIRTLWFARRLVHGCRWRRVAQQDKQPFTKWVCQSCRVEAFSSDKKAPKECKKALKPRA